MDTRFAAAYLGYSPATLRLWRRKGAGPRFYTVGRFVEYRQEDLDTWSGGEDMVALKRAERRAKIGTKARTGKRAPASDFGSALAGVNSGNWS
ncbi:MAG TPA: helix-turn-helix domain-containing protein [Terriglobales bacterium]|nr:helix-turn-helix domain-containing protein [Terriglobales bacterium]